MTTTDKQTRRWIDELVVALRLRDIRGDAIGDAVATVESYCAESGETPQDAFGDPRAYAAQLEFPATRTVRTSPAEWVRTLAPVAAGGVAVTLGPQVARAARLGQDVGISTGSVASLVALTVLLLLVGRFLGPVVRHPLLGAPLLTVGFVLVVLAGRLPGTLLHVPVWLGVALTAVLLALSVACARTGEPQLDPVLDPRDGRDRYGSPRGRAAGRTFAALTGWVFVVVTAALAALAWSTAR